MINRAGEMLIVEGRLDSELKRRYRAALTVTRAAGELSADYFRRRATLAVERKGLQDLVSEADRATEELIVTALSRSFPTDSFLGEEGGLRKNGPMLWIIDPIDGTANFLRGIPHWCVSLGLVFENRVVLGFLYDPIANEMFSARKGQGAFVNGAPIKVSGEADLRQSRIGLGFSYRRAVGPHADDIRALLDSGCEYSRLGSGALGLAYTAAGRLDGYFERHINIWDVAAGLVIVEEAGGCTNDFLTANVAATGNEILATTPLLFGPLRRLLERTDQT
jgi:myo-inositol-1(or 4)-monophosphatase